MPHQTTPTRELQLAGFPVAIFCEDPRLRASLDPWLDLFVTDGVEASGAGGPGAAAPPDVSGPGSGAPPDGASGPLGSGRLAFHFSVLPDDSIPSAHPEGQTTVEYLYVSGSQTGERAVYRGTDGSILVAEPAAGRAVCAVPLSAADGPPWVLRDLFNAGLTTFLRARGKYPLHAAAIARQDSGTSSEKSAADGILIAGPPMSGKTWLAINFMRRGWSWLADDKVLLSLERDRSGDAARSPQQAAQPSPHAAAAAPALASSSQVIAAAPAPESSPQVVASGLFRHFNIDPGLARYFPELAELSRCEPLYPHSDKRGIHLESIYGEGRRSSCVPELILIPRVVDLGPTQVQPLDASSAFIELLRQTPLVNDPSAARGALEVLSCLTRTTRAFRVEMGRDLLEHPNRLPDLARDIGICVGPPRNWR